MSDTIKTEAGARAVCPVCPRHCAPDEGQAGFCRARRAEGGRVVAAGYGRLTALALDPIEKKPLYHFHPGSRVLSVGGTGCNLRCPFCQNHEISQDDGGLAGDYIAPGALAKRAKALVPQGNIGLAFTYNEPAVCWEYVRDAGGEAKKLGLRNVMVTNGYFCDAVLDGLLGVVDAFNIDLKCFTQAGYERLGGQLATVIRTIERAHAIAHVEVTTLVVPGLSDSEADMERQAAWLAGLSPGIPLHLSRYFPRWQAHMPPTPPATLHRLAEIAKRHLTYVHLGNL